MFLMLRKAWIAKRGRGNGVGQRVEVECLGKPLYPKDGPEIASEFQYDEYKATPIEDMTKFAVSLGFNPCVLIAEAIDANLASAEKRNEIDSINKGQILIAHGLATDANRDDKVKAFLLMAKSQNIEFQELVDLMVMAREMKAAKTQPTV